MIYTYVKHPKYNSSCNRILSGKIQYKRRKMQNKLHYLTQNLNIQTISMVTVIKGIFNKILIQRHFPQKRTLMFHGENKPINISRKGDKFIRWFFAMVKY